MGIFLGENRSLLCAKIQSLHSLKASSYLQEKERKEKRGKRERIIEGREEGRKGEEVKS